MNYYSWFNSVTLLTFVAGAVNTETYSNMMYNIENLRNAPRNPFFHSQSQHFKIKIGADVTFPCYVNNKGSDVITWKNGVRLLTAGPIKVYNEDRLVHRYNGSEITLRDVQPKDEGEYACQLNRIDTPIELVHHLDVLIPPRVVSRETEVSARTGSSAELECVAHGNPPPTIHWRKVHPNSQTQSLQIGSLGVGSRLVLERVSREDGGQYECVATNGVEDDEEIISSIITLTVHYQPEVTVNLERRQYHPKLKQQHLSISCNVSADPSPDVNWQRGRLVISTHDNKQISDELSSNH